jgi:hypothetical protein
MIEFDEQGDPENTSLMWKDIAWFVFFWIPVAICVLAGVLYVIQYGTALELFVFVGNLQLGAVLIFLRLILRSIRSKGDDK